MSVLSRLFAAKPVAPQIPIPTPHQAEAETETAWYSPYFFAQHGQQFEVWNLDILKQRKGADIYKKMLRDPQIKAAFNLVLDIIISRSYRFEISNESPLQSEISDFFWYCLQQMRGTWSQAMRIILMAKAHGVSVSEKIYRTAQFNSKSKWIIDRIAQKPIETFTFRVDNFGNRLGLIQDQSGIPILLDIDKFIVFVVHPEQDVIYGESDLMAAYPSYWSKTNILKFWDIYTERLAGGFVVAKANLNAPSLSPAERANFENVLKNIQQFTSMRVPAGYDVEIVQGINTEAFQSAVEHRDRQIAKSLLVPNLLGFSESGQTGAYAQSKTQFETFLNVIKCQGDLLADCLNEQLFAELALWNYGVTEYPRFVFEPFSDDQKRLIAESWIGAVESGVVINTIEDENRVRELLLFDARTEKSISPKTSTQQQTESAIPSESQFSENSRIWMNRIDFAENLRVFDETEQQFLEMLSGYVDQALEETEEMLVMIGKRLADQKQQIDMPAELEKLKSAITPNTKREMNEIIKTFLRQMYNEGRTMAKSELKRAAEQTEPAIKKRVSLLAELSRSVATTKQPWTVAQFIEGIALDTAEKYLSARAFWITGVISQEILDQAQLVLLNGIRDEKSIPEIIEELRDVVSPLAGKYDPVTKEIDAKERARLETIIRTNLSDAFNQSQAAVFTDPELGDFVQAFEYSSIMDSRTTPFCRAYDGKVFLKTDTVWKSITPPNHYNCRSRLIPVTAVDQFKPWTGEIRDPDTGQSVQQEKGFGRTIEKASGEPVLSRL